MVKFSIVFRCHKRPNLTELCLRRIVEMMRGVDYDLIVLYDGDDWDYVYHLESIANIRQIVRNPLGETMGELLNKAYSLCTGEYILHFENDYYWIKPCLQSALEAIGYVDTVRLTMFPFTISNCEREVILHTGKLCIFKEKVGYKFSLNPHIRREAFPVGPFEPLRSWRVESEYATRYTEQGKSGGCLMSDNFIHLGLYNARGGFSAQHAMYFLGRDWKERLDELDPVGTLEQLTDNELYIDLFRQYLLDHGGERFVV